MTAKKIIITTAILLGATSAGLAQSAWTTGSAADRERAGYASPYGSGSMPTRRALRRIHSNGLRAYGMVPQALPQSSDDPALVGGGSVGYNEMQRRAWRIDKEERFGPLLLSSLPKCASARSKKLTDLAITQQKVEQAHKPPMWHRFNSMRRTPHLKSRLYLKCSTISAPTNGTVTNFDLPSGRYVP